MRNWFVFSASERWREDGREHEHDTDAGGKSGGQTEKLGYTVLAASLAYQFGLEWGVTRSRSFRFVVIDEAFGRGSDESARYGLELFTRMNLQVLIVTPLQKIHMMMCDFLITADNARFGQPEIKVGVTPGAGGTQRLPRTIGKAKAMDLLLTARMIDAAEAERTGLVSRVVPADKLMEEALAAATVVAAMSVTVAMAIKDSVNRAFETTLTEGVRYERRYFHAAFGTPAQKEGMSAFLAKRPAKFDGL